MTWLSLIAALLAAPAHMAETRAADSRMQCELLHIDEGIDGQHWVSVGRCARLVQRNADGSRVEWVENLLVANYAALGIEEPKG